MKKRILSHHLHLSTLLYAFFVGMLCVQAPVSGADVAKANKEKKEEKKGVSAPVPREPQKRWQTPQELISRSSEIKGTDNDLPSFKGFKLGISKFEGDNSGRELIANNLWQEILSDTKRKELFVDKAKTDQVVAELERSQSDWARLTPEQKTEKVGKLIFADYLVFVTVTEYKSGDQQLTVSEVYLDGEVERYKKEYDLYVKEVKEEIDRLDKKIHGPEGLIGFVRRRFEAEKAKWEAALQALKKPEQFENELKTRASFQTVGSVGVAVTVIEVKSGKPVWVANGSQRDISLDSSGKAVSRDLLKKLLSKTPTL